MTSYPAKAPKRVVPEYNVAVCCVRRRASDGNDASLDEFLMTQRPKKGLLAGQWEFVAIMMGELGEKGDPPPAYDARKRVVDEKLVEESINVKPSASRRDVGVFTHKFSHQHHRMFVEEIVWGDAEGKISARPHGGGCLCRRWMHAA